MGGDCGAWCRRRRGSGRRFAAFPNWYATLFSGFYLALLLMLVALIVRGVAFEFRSKDKNPRWRALWDWCIFGGSLVPALLWGVALANIVKGVPIGPNMQYVGGFFNLLNPYALLGGLVAVAVMTLHGAIFLSLRTTDEMLERAHKTAQYAWPIATLLLFALVVATYFATDIFKRLGVNPGISAIGAGIAILLAGAVLVNDAVTPLATSIVTRQVSDTLPTQASPLQPLKYEPAVGVAVRVTMPKAFSQCQMRTGVGCR